MRIEFPEYLCRLALVASHRSEDPDTKVGCVVADRDYRILSVGYNGLAPGQQYQKYWSRADKLKYFIHAEANALSMVSKIDNPFYIASNVSPCLACAQSIAASGIRVVYYITEYHRDSQFKSLFDYMQIVYHQIPIH